MPLSVLLLTKSAVIIGDGEGDHFLRPHYLTSPLSNDIERFLAEKFGISKILLIFAADMRRTEITQSIKEALKSVPYKMEARLYGSEARGDARHDSDIDLLILVDLPIVTGKDEDAIFAPLYQVELQSGVLINPLIIPKSQWGVNVSPFYINVENEGVPL